MYIRVQVTIYIIASFNLSLNATVDLSKESLIIINRSGTLAHVTIKQKQECQGKTLETEIKSTKLFDGITETITFRLPVLDGSCHVQYVLEINLPELRRQQVSPLPSNMSAYVYEIYDSREGQPLLQAIEHKNVRPGVFVQ